MNWLQAEINKMAGWNNWFSVSDEAQQNMDRLARENALQGALHSLSGVQNDPQVAAIVQQIRALMQQ